MLVYVCFNNTFSYVYDDFFLLFYILMLVYESHIMRAYYMQSEKHINN